MNATAHLSGAVALASSQRVSPLLLPRLSRNEAQARTLLAQRAQGVSVLLAEQPWRLSLEPWLAGAALSTAQPGDWLVQAQWAGALFDLRLPASACQAWIAARFPELELPGLAEPLSAAALELALAGLSETLLALKRGPVRLEQVQYQPVASRPLGQHFGLTLARGDERILGSLSTDSLGLMLMAGLVSGLPGLSNGLADGPGLPILLRAEIGSARLPLQTLQGLTLGDTVLMAHSFISQDGQLWLGRGGLGLRVAWQDSKLVVTQTLSPTGTAMPSDTESAAGDPTLPLDSVPVTLSFDLGERSIPLGELKALQVGQVLELDRPLSQPVRIRANGALIGTGELVEIDGRLGVTIATIATLATPAPP